MRMLNNLLEFMFNIRIKEIKLSKSNKEFILSVSLFIGVVSLFIGIGLLVCKKYFLGCLVCLIYFIIPITIYILNKIKIKMDN